VVAAAVPPVWRRSWKWASGTPQAMHALRQAGKLVRAREARPDRTT
jgi:hypothetical protein